MYPHLRGADSVYSGGSDRLDRCIPTCVGQTTVISLKRTLIGVYPHLRGADYPISFTVLNSIGVSPPAWGRLFPVFYGRI